MKHKSNRQSSRAVDKAEKRGGGGERRTTATEANKHKMPIKRVSRNASEADKSTSGNKPGANC